MESFADRRGKRRLADFPATRYIKDTSKKAEALRITRHVFEQMATYLTTYAFHDNQGTLPPAAIGHPNLKSPSQQYETPLEGTRRPGHELRPRAKLNHLPSLRDLSLFGMVGTCRKTISLPEVCGLACIGSSQAGRCRNAELCNSADLSTCESFCRGPDEVPLLAGRKHPAQQAARP